MSQVAQRGGGPPQDASHEKVCWDDGTELSAAQRERIMALIRKCHQNMGHPHPRAFRTVLKHAGVHRVVLELLKQFTCPICQEASRAPLKPPASAHTPAEPWVSLSFDQWHWTHPVSKRRGSGTLYIDEGSSKASVTIYGHVGQYKNPPSVTTETLVQGLCRDWIQHFGKPLHMRGDPAGWQRSEELRTWCERRGIDLEIIPAEAYWKKARVERAIGIIKDCILRMALEDHNIPYDELWYLGVDAHNDLYHEAGYSPNMVALGREVRLLEGDLVTANPAQLSEALDEKGAYWVTQQRRTLARICYLKAHASAALHRAELAKTRIRRSWQVGDMACYWRSQGHLGGAGHKRGAFLGPCPVVHQRKTRNTLVAGAVWLLHGSHLTRTPQSRE